MIITSLLDTDLYKFTMMQVVLHQFPGAQVEYRFVCRNAASAGVGPLAPYVAQIREEIRALVRRRGLTVVLVTHGSEANQYATQRLRLEAGRWAIPSPVSSLNDSAS
jgi:hypothetical protein